MSEKSQVTEGYKKTELGEIPEEWDVGILKHFCEKLCVGFVGTCERYYTDSTGIPMIRTGNLKNGRLDLSNLKYVTSEFHEKNKKSHIMSGDILIARHGENGQASIVPEKFKEGNCLNIVILRANVNYFNKTFLKYLINSDEIKKCIEKRSGGSTQKVINTTEIMKLKIYKPSLPEQHIIASILSKVDEQIEQTEQIIERIEILKKGLMQKLLTKGIGHTKFKKTELGEIPEEWRVVQLQDCCNKITDGSHYSPKSVEDSHYRIATIANINNDEFDLKSCKKISKDEYEALVRNGCKPDIGDVLFSKDGTVGLCLVYRQEASLVLLSSIAIIPPKREILDSDFCSHILKSDLILNEIIGRKTGTAIRRVVLRDLKTVKVPIPALPEQQKIASILSKVDNQIQDNHRYLTRLQELKKGLMQDLLTGKVRVTV